MYVTAQMTQPWFIEIIPPYCIMFIFGATPGSFPWVCCWPPPACRRSLAQAAADTSPGEYQYQNTWSGDPVTKTTLILHLLSRPTQNSKFLRPTTLFTLYFVAIFAQKTILFGKKNHRTNKSCNNCNWGWESNLLVEWEYGLLVDVIAGGDDQVSEPGQVVLLTHQHKGLLHNPTIVLYSIQ